MIQIIAGLAGAGKTKSLIELANKEALETSGHIVYVDADHSHVLQLNHSIRLINVDDLALESAAEFYGLVCGILSQDYDIVTIYIDGLLKNAKADVTNVEALVRKMSYISEKFSVNLKISMSCDPESLPQSVREYLI